ncbi:MAG: hypothetical protein QXF77_04465, partial [Candidatus Jordarchaeales archaeon]
ALRGSTEEGDNLMGDAMLKPAAFASAVNPGMILEARSVEGTPRRAIPLHTLMTRIAQLFLRVRGVSGEEVETRTELGGRRLDALTFTVSLGGVEEGGLAKETVDFIRGFLPRGEMVVLEEGGLLAFALEVKTFSDRLDPGEVGKMVERVEGLRRRLGRCAVIPVMLNAGAFSEDLRKFFGREPGATITSGDVTLTLRGKPKNGYYVVWAEMKDMKAAIMIVDCWRAPRGDLASTLATIISVMAGMPRTWGQRKRASDALIALCEIDKDLGMGARYIEERGWPVLPYEYYLESCMRNPAMARLAIETLMMRKERIEEAVKLAMELAQKLPPEVLANEIINMTLPIPEEKRLELVLKVSLKLPKDELAAKADDLIRLMPDKEAKMELAKTIMKELSKDELAAKADDLIRLMPDKEAKIEVARVVAEKVAEGLPLKELARKILDVMGELEEDGAKLEVAGVAVKVLPPEKLRLYLPAMIDELAGREAKLVLLEAASSKLPREDVEYMTKMLEGAD